MPRKTAGARIGRVHVAPASMRPRPDAAENAAAERRRVRALPVLQ